MKRAEVTYGQLDKALRSLGFTCRPSEQDPPGRIYKHESTGATIELPPLPEGEKVYEYHMITARVELEHFGIADPKTTAAKLVKSS